MRAHLFQQCNNFKDPGVQQYGGSLFKKLQGEADDIFCKLAPPKPSGVGGATVYSMSLFHNCNDPCFSGEGLVRLVGGETKRVDEIVRGDRVEGPNNTISTIACVIRTKIPKGTTKLVELPGGLVLTPYHPVKLNDKWVFPAEVAPTTDRPCTAVYSFVIANGTEMNINGIQCITLGHGRDEGILSHLYWGTRRVLDDLQRHSSWKTGLIDLTPQSIIRDGKGLAFGIRVPEIPDHLKQTKRYDNE